MSHPSIMMMAMNQDGTTIECATCPAVGTTACSDCIVTHLLANDDGPIELRVVDRVADPDDAAIELLQRAGMLDEEPVYVSIDEFEASARRHPARSAPVR